ncbi:MAG: hypothetical protein JWM47_4189, partial [Acidimicrobiales bacterium]|nr:hypothetical protein [Acidimicrobiales bacterium]
MCETAPVEAPTEFVRLQSDFHWSGVDRLVVVDGRWTSSDGGVHTAFSANLLSAIDLAAQNGWWHSTRNHLIRDTLGWSGITGPIWEIGSGTGVVAMDLQRHGIDVVAVEPSEGSVIAAGKGVAVSVDSTLEALQLPCRSVGAVGLFDVLEH